MRTNFEPPSAISAPIAGSKQTYPVRRIYCVGCMQANPTEKTPADPGPAFYAKWPETFVPTESQVAIPTDEWNFHFEGALVVAIKEAGSRICAKEAHRHIFGYALGMNLVRRPRNRAARPEDLLFASCINLDEPSPIGNLHRASEIGHFDDARFIQSVDGSKALDWTLSEMSWSVEEMVATVSRTFDLMPGDLLMAGRLALVGPVKPGQSIAVEMEDFDTVEVRVMNANGSSEGR